MTRIANLKHPTDQMQFIYCWRRREIDATALAYVAKVLRDPAQSVQAAEWVDRLNTASARREDAAILQLRRLRHEMKGVSLLLAKACAFEGLSLSAMLYGILPIAHVPESSEGFPWSAIESPASWRAVSKFYTSRMRDGWERLHHANGAFVRPRVHSSGGWGVRVRRGVVHGSFIVDGCDVRSNETWPCTIQVPQAWPETYLSMFPGRRLHAVVGHPIVDDPAFVIRSAVSTGEGTTISFRSPVIPVAFDELRAEAGMEHQQLGRNGELSGEEALLDVSGRGVRPVDAYLRSKERAAIIAAGFARHELTTRMLQINSMCPPWAEKLQLPD
ncbi:hypothetical protein [Sphingomonas sp. R86520]|uniref:hypothetical protein n=1 Tax=Sphingomonas sp. R86520 TaxID=3093859 RepID=UPI0036D436D2